MLNRMILTAAILTVALAADADACHRRRRRVAACPPPAAYACPAAPAYYPAAPISMPQAIPATTMPIAQLQPAPVAAVPSATGADAHGFTAWLNNVRAQHGLSAVGYSPDLEAWAAINSAQQAASGTGHYTLGPARMQNAAMGAPESVGSMWLASPPHRATLLNPSIRFIGIAWNGPYATLNTD